MEFCFNPTLTWMVGFLIPSAAKVFAKSSLEEVLGKMSTMIEPSVKPLLSGEPISTRVV